MADIDQEAIVKRAELEVDVLCDLAATAVRSHSPIGLGDAFRAEAAALEALLDEIPRRFKTMMRRARRSLAGTRAHRESGCGADG